MKKYNLISSIFAVAIFASCTKQIEETPGHAEKQSIESNAAELTRSAPGQGQKERHVPNELLVKFVRGASVEARANALARIDGAAKEKILTKAMIDAGDDEGFVLVRTPLAALDAVNKVRGAEVEFAEPNYIYSDGAVSTDTYFSNGSLWGMYGNASTPRNVNGSQAAEAWAVGHTGSRSVFVGVIDGGIQLTHPDLSGQVWTNPYDRVDGIDNDGNGYIDDINGWDFANNNRTIYDGGINADADNHGTHVAGTIGAKSNGVGVVGVNWLVTMISCKFLGTNGQGTSANAVRAVDYLTDLKTRHGIRIVASNNSWGGGGYSQALYDAIQRANGRNILFVAAAGNGGSDQRGDNNDLTPHYPSSYNNSNIIAVASLTLSGNRSLFSNYGPRSVDICAPGSGIYSTIAPNTYSSYSGTSMATPHVTGGAALYASTHSGASAATIKAALLGSAIPTASYTGLTVTGGRLDVGGF